MISVRYAVLATALLFLAVAASAQRGKVFTNEDMSRSRPSRPAAREAAAEQQQQPAAAESAQAAPAATEQLTGPQAELKKALELQGTFRDSLEVYFEKMDRETDPARRDRWDRMVACLSTLLQQNQAYINELQASSE
ncbi:MAG: hypothetical protein O7A06_05100 [Acidobacteria bacterium]|nr:hypothetical protein [Acidobacteriota bacterium]MCZ6752855.1 hypothetical protein [Acidobacteriota bacterium]